MGLIRSGFWFLVGNGCGIYIAQNYNVPNIMKIVNAAIGKAKKIEEENRKPEGKNR